MRNETPYEWTSVDRRSSARGQAFSTALLLAFLEWYTGGAWSPILLLLLAAFMLGMNHPTEMPCGVLLLGLSMPAVHLIATAVGFPGPRPLAVPVAVLSIPSAFLGAYSGVAAAHLFRWVRGSGWGHKATAIGTFSSSRLRLRVREML